MKVDGGRAARLKYHKEQTGSRLNSGRENATARQRYPNLAGSGMSGANPPVHFASVQIPDCGRLDHDSLRQAELLRFAWQMNRKNGRLTYDERSVAKIGLKLRKKNPKRKNQNSDGQSEKPQQPGVLSKQISLRTKYEPRLVQEQRALKQMSNDQIRRTAHRLAICEAAKNQQRAKRRQRADSKQDC